MAEDEEIAKSNGESVNGTSGIRIEGAVKEEEITLVGALRRLLSAIFVPDASSSASWFQRTRAAINDNASSFRLGCTNSSQELIRWTRRGSPLRALLVISVGTVTLLALTGLLVFMLFFVAATANAVIVSFLVSLAVAGGFLAFFFACVTAIYVAALSLGVFIISTATISTIVAVLIATGWVGFLCMVWLAAQKSMILAKQSLSMTGSALSAYSTARHFRSRSSEKVTD